MPEDTNDVERRVLTDHDRIRQLAEIHGAVPIAVERVDGREGVGLESEPGTAASDRIGWETFFERFDRAGTVVLYRPGVTEDEPAETFAVVDREDRAGDSPEAESTDETADVAGERFATSDTGEAEPVTVDRAEGEPPGSEEAGEAAVSPAQDTERASSEAAEGLVLDEIHENPVGPDDANLDEEYLVFANAGEAPIDLSGWTVENEAGRSYRFPDGTVLDPGERITLHSGTGWDDEDHRYWGADESVWGNMRDTVVVKTAEGERVIREPYEA